MARSFTAIPGAVLIICLFLPAIRVCGDVRVPVTFPPCYVFYVGGSGVVVLALARSRRLLKFGVALLPTLAVLTIGETLMYRHQTAPIVVIVTLCSAVMVPWLIVRRMPSERVMALVALIQGIGSTVWAAFLVTEENSMWGAFLTLLAGISLVIGATLWLDAVAQTPDLPRAIVR